MVADMPFDVRFVLVGCELPLQLASLGSPELAAAVSSAGGPAMISTTPRTGKALPESSSN
jgi:hypothetical protein